MNRWNRKTRPWVYRYLATRDGEKCLLCGRPATTKRHLEIDHIDSNSQNEDPANLCLLCPPCNKHSESLTPKERKQLLSRVYAVCVCAREKEGGKPATELGKTIVDYTNGTPEMKANDLYEVHYRQWLLRNIKKLGSYPKKEAITSGAEFVGCSVATSARYLSKLTSFEGILEIGHDASHQEVLVFKLDKITNNISVEGLIKQALARAIKKPKRRRKNEARKSYYRPINPTGGKTPTRERL